MVKKIVLLTALVFVTGAAFAEERKVSPQEQQQAFQQQWEMMTPMFGQMMKAMIQAQVDVLSEPETADKLAAYTKNYYDALVKKGFSKEEALRIVMAVGFPSSPGMQK